MSDLKNKNDMLGAILLKLVEIPSCVLGALYDLIIKLANPRWHGPLKQFLRREDPWLIADPQVWMTIKLGTGLKSGSDFIEEFKRVNRKISNLITAISLGNNGFTVASRSRELYLFRLSPEDLGFLEEKIEYGDFCAKARTFGLGLCSLEAGLQLCLQLTKQSPMTDKSLLRIAMDPFLITSDGGLYGFLIGHDSSGGFTIHTGGFRSSDCVDVDQEFVFCRYR